MLSLFDVLASTAIYTLSLRITLQICGKGDWAFAAFIGLMSWVGTGLFVGMMLAMFAASKIYNAGMWVSERLGYLA